MQLEMMRWPKLAGWFRSSVGRSRVVERGLIVVAGGHAQVRIAVPSLLLVLVAVGAATGQDWIEEAKLTASDAASGDQFGGVALVGDRALIAAPLDDVHAGGFVQEDAGSAYIFELSADRWTQMAKLTASDAERYDRFGRSVAFDGDRALIGAYLDDHRGGKNAGSAYVFERE